MRMLTLILEILSFSFALWLGCYLPARNSAKAVLRLTGLGLVAYAFSLAGNLLSEYAPTSRLMVGFGVVHPGLLFLPTLCWVGATIHLLPETTPLRNPARYSRAPCPGRNRLCAWLLRRGTLFSCCATAYQPETGACRHSAGCHLGNR